MFKKPFVCLFVVLLSSQVFADPPLPTPVGRVVWVKGKLNAVMENKEQRSLQKMSVIYLHDTLVTDDTSQAQIVFTDDSLMTFAPKSQFIIKDYQFNPKDKKTSGSYVMNLVEGSLRTITGLIAKKNPNDYKINTPVATIGVRGTDFTISYRNGKLDMGYKSGRPCIKTAKDKEPVCLDKENPFATTDGQTITFSKIAPTGLSQDLQVDPAKIAPFEGSGGNGGTTTSFCIS